MYIFTYVHRYIYIYITTIGQNEKNNSWLRERESKMVGDLAKAFEVSLTISEGARPWSDSRDTPAETQSKSYSFHYTEL